MGAIASQITNLTIVYSTVYSDADKKKTPKLRVTGISAGNTPGTGEIPAQMASNAENVSIWWRHHGLQQQQQPQQHRRQLHLLMYANEHTKNYRQMSCLSDQILRK